MTPGHVVTFQAFARGLEPDPSLSVDEWSDQFMFIPKSSGANEYGKYRTSRTPHARRVMQVLSDSHPCKRVVLVGASQMLKTQVGLNWFAASVHQSPSNFLWILPTGKLAKRTSMRISKTIAEVPQLAERVASPRSRDSVNTLDTKEYEGGTLFIVTAGAAANLSEVPARRVLFDEIDRAERNVNGEGNPVKLAEARQSTFERNRKSYYPCSPTIKGESIIDELYETGTKEEALAECVHCSHAQTLEFERLILSDDGQVAMYSCIECGQYMYESDKNRMFRNGLWSEGVPGDGETISLQISGMFAPYGWTPWKTLYNEYQLAKVALDNGDEELMITFYNTRLARCWERAKEQTKYQDLMDRAEGYRLGRVPPGGLKITAAIDTQNNRLEMKVVAWGEGVEGWIIDYQIIHSSPADDATWARADELLYTLYKNSHGIPMPIEATFIDSGGGYTQEVYNFTKSRRHRKVFAIKGASKPNKPIISAKPTQVDINIRGKVEKRGTELWHIGTDTAKDYLASRWKRVTGSGAIHFSKELPEEYFKQLTVEYRVTLHKNGRKFSKWEKKPGDRNEAGDLMVYNLAAAHFLGIHKMTEGHWQRLREKLEPANMSLLSMLDADDQPEQISTPDVQTSAQKIKPQTKAASTQAKEIPAQPKIIGGRISLAGMRRG